MFVGYKVSQILMKNRKLLTLIIHGQVAPLYTKNIYPALYIPLYRSNMALGEDNKYNETPWTGRL